MSMSPDDPDFLARIQNSLTSGINSPLMGLAAGLLQAGGPSPYPKSLGQALGQGLQTGQQFQQAGLQNAMQQLMLGQNMYGMDALRQVYGGGGGNAAIPPAFQQYFPNQGSSPQATQGASTGSNPLLAAASPQADMATPGLLTGMQPQQAPATTAASQPSVQPPAAPANTPPPWLQQVAKDNQALSLLSRSPMLKDQADQLRQRMQNTYYPMPPDMVQKFTGAPPEKGYGYQINEMGEVKPTGESIYIPVSGQGPNGTYQQGVFNKATGQTIWPTNSASQRVPGTPLASPSDESYAQGLAEYKYKPPGVGQRNSAQAVNWLTRASEINPAFDENAYDAKHAAYLSMAAGKDYNTNSAYSTIQTHMDTLKQAFDANQNGDIQSANKLINWSGKQLGKSAPQNLKVVNDIVVGELAKVLAQGGVVTDAVRNEAAGDLEPYLSKGQFQGAVDYIQQLVAGKMNTSYINAKANKIPDDVFMAHLTPEARAQLQRFQQEHPDNGASTGLPQGWTVQVH